MLLIEQSRYALAEKELRQSLADEPDDALAHAVLAICLTRLKQHAVAMREAELAVGFDPEQPYVFFAKSIVELERNCFEDAEQSIQTAIGLDPNATDYFAQLARIELERACWQKALAAAQQGLELDPEDVDCSNLQAIALNRLGRQGEANEAIKTALKRNPEDADTHANMGWSLLESGEPEEAMKYFRESLRLNPENDWARQGIVEAMKARYLFYRILLGWFVWMMNLSSGVQWAVLIGAFIGYQALRSLAVHNPALLPWLMPLLLAYATFAIMTWVASPLLNLVLRMTRFGRLALTPEQIRTSNWVGICVLGAVVFLVLFVVRSFPYGHNDWDWDSLLCAIACLLTIPPLANIYTCDAGWPRAMVIEITLALAILAVIILVCLPFAWIAFDPLSKCLRTIGYWAFMIFLFSAIAAQFALNALVRVRPRPGSITTASVWIYGSSLLAIGILVFLAFSVRIMLLFFGRQP